MSDKQQKVVANIAKIAGNLPDDARERILVFAQGVSAGASLRDDRAEPGRLGSREVIP